MLLRGRSVIMKKLHKSIFAVAFVLSVAASAAAATRSWTGAGGDNEWNNEQNWSGNALPTYADTVRFTNDVPLSVRVHSKNPLGKIWRFEGKDVTFGSDQGRRVTMYFSNSPTCEVFVAEGTTVVSSNTISMYNQAPLIKTGKGCFKLVGRSDATTNMEKLFQLDIREGELRSVPSSGAYGAYMTHIDDIYVRSGARLTHEGYNSLSSDLVFHIEKDASVYIDTNYSSCNFSSVVGEGDLELGPNTELKLTFVSGISEFSGTVRGASTAQMRFVKNGSATEENRRFLVGKGDTLAAVNISDEVSALRFAPGIGSFSIGSLATGAGGALGLDDEDGEPVSLTVKLTESSHPVISGSGSLFLKGSVNTFTNGQLLMSGLLSADKTSTLALGNGTEEGNVDFSGLSAINSSKSITIANTAPTVFDKPFTGSGEFKNYTDLTLGDFRMTNVQVHAISNLVLAGGQGFVRDWRCWTDQSVLTVSGGMFCHGKSVGKFRTSSVLPTPEFITVASDHIGTYVFVGGETWMENPYGQVGLLKLLGGRCVLNSGFCAAKDSTAENPTVAYMDGGTLVFSSRNYQYWYHFPAETDAFEVQVGAKGGIVDSVDLPSSYCTDTSELRLNTRFVTAPDCQADGGMTFDLRRTGQTLRPYRPFLISGPFTVRDGRVALDYYSPKWHSDLVTYPSFFGTGDFTLDSSVIVYDDTSSTGTLPEESVLKLASGAGSRMTVCGSSAIRFRENTEKPKRKIVVGAENAAAYSAFRRERGGALFLFDAGFTPGDDGSVMKVNGGVPVYEECGLSKLPVFWGKSVSGHVEAYFMSYDPEKGFGPFRGSVSSFNGAAGKVVETEGASLAAGTETSVLALKVNDWQTLTVNSGAKLNVGNGTDPACIIMEYQSAIGGSGTIDFGTSEGLIVAGMYFYDEGFKLSCRLAGENGVSYVASPDYANHLVRVSGENTYSGPTYISAAAVAVQNARAFSAGKVFVGGGHRNGGKVVFNRPLEIANDFKVSGAGHRLKLDWSKRNGGWGALSFLTNGVVLTGSVEIDNMAMVSAQHEGCEGTLRGVVSGGRLQVYPGAGRVVLAAPNTYTGGTEIVQASLVLAGASPSVGTGAVAFDNGVLRFENTSPLVFTNRIEGVGRIELAGAPVVFASPEFSSLTLTNLAAGSVIDLSKMAESVLVAAVGEDGLDLGGRDITVAGVAGSGRVFGGTLTVTGEINPGGADAIGRLTFEKAPVLDGAVYVCDLIGDRADEIAVEEDFALTGISLRAVSPRGRNTLHYADVFTSGGELSGTFAAAEFPRGRYSVQYQESRAVLTKANPLKIIVR